jgi:hypothetical protein
MQGNILTTFCHNGAFANVPCVTVLELVGQGHDEIARHRENDDRARPNPLSPRPRHAVRVGGDVSCRFPSRQGYCEP